MRPARHNLPAACTGTDPPTSADNCGFLPIYPNLTSASNPPVGAVQYFDDDFQLPQIHQWDFIFEREIARNTVVSASYLGSFGNSLPNFVDTNLPQAVASRFAERRRWTVCWCDSSDADLRWSASESRRSLQITEIRSDVYSKYHALVLQANRRLTEGLQFQTNYTLSRASDNGQSSVTFTSNNLPFNAFDQSAEDGLSNFDRRQKFVASVVYSPNSVRGRRGEAHLQRMDARSDSERVLGSALYRQHRRQHRSEHLRFRGQCLYSDAELPGSGRLLDSGRRRQRIGRREPLLAGSAQLLQAAEHLVRGHAPFAPVQYH